MSKAMTVTPLKPGWLENRSIDLSLVVGITLIASAVAAIAGLDPFYFQMLVLADLWLLGYHHVIATFTKLAGTTSDRRQNFALIWLLFPAVLAATVALGHQHGVIAIVTLYFFWQWFHYVRQSWGITQRYRYRAGGLTWDPQWLSEATLWSIPIWGVLHRCHQNPETFIWLPIWMPAIPLWSVQIAGLASVALTFHWFATRLQAWRNRSLPIGHTLYMASHFVMFFFAYVAIDDITLGWLLVNVWHNAQYLLFVWIHNRQRFSGGVNKEGLLVSWLSQPGFLRAAIYFGSCLLVSTGIYAAISNGFDLLPTDTNLPGDKTKVTIAALVVVFSMAINFHHYIVDSIIWKRRSTAK